MKKNKKKYGFKKVEHLSFSFSLYKIRDYHASKDIAGQTAKLFIQKKITDNEDGIRKWIFATTSNLCNEYLRERKKNIKLNKRYENKLLLDSILDKSETDEKLRTAFKKAYSNLNEEQKKTIILYYNCDRNYKLMQMITDISTGALRQRISRIKGKLKAETFINMGMIITKKILTPEVEHLLYNFLNSFRTHLEDGFRLDTYQCFVRSLC
jgi:RNA polymerase sigma factor (sigma-70 family)